MSNKKFKAKLQKIGEKMLNKDATEKLEEIEESIDVENLEYVPGYGWKK